MRKLLIFSTLLFVMWGCCVKEDRSGCPANIHLSLSERALSIAGNTPVKVRLGDGKRTAAVTLSAYSPDCWESVERGVVSVAGILDNGAGTVVARGGQSDSLWAFSGDHVVSGEEEEIVLELHKRFATIYITFDDEIETGRYHIMVLGDIGGTDLTRMTPVEGDFICELAVEDHSSSVRVPAQGPDSGLRLQFSDRATGELSWDWDLAAELAAQGYDWNADDLEDIRVTVRLLPLELNITFGDWSDGGSVG
ncbi:MAG: hypothetical protein IK030_03485 [Bacteroidales bacterium]|nr:hypothetical protein [Bacteroidales bacterium]